MAEDARRRRGDFVGIPRRAFDVVPRALGGVWRAVRKRPGLFIVVTLAVFVLNLLLPPAVLSVARKPWNYFAFNPWLHNVFDWLRSDDSTVGRKLTFLYNMALFWFIADSPYDAPEWGYTATVKDVARMLAVSLLFGAYFALWSAGRSRRAGLAPPARVPPKVRVPGAAQGGVGGGVGGAVLSTLGLSTMPCSVVGCGAPVLPVLGLALTGLSSGTLSLMSRGSTLITTIVMAAVAAAVLVQGWRISAERDAAPPRLSG